VRAHLTSPSLPGTRGRVLLVEDDPNSGEALCELLAFLGYACHWTQSHEGALARLRDPSANDILILDLDIHRDNDGVALVRRAREAGLRMPPILVFSALGDEALHAAVREIGAQGVLRKPSGGDALCDAIENTMAAHGGSHPESVTPH
jgi:DNA-binding response OmpR family regulator